MARGAAIGAVGWIAVARREGQAAVRWMGRARLARDLPMLPRRMRGCWPKARVAGAANPLLYSRDGGSTTERVLFSAGWRAAAPTAVRLTHIARGAARQRISDVWRGCLLDAVWGLRKE